MSDDNVSVVGQLDRTDKVIRRISDRSAIVELLKSRDCTQKEIKELLKEYFGLDLTTSQVWHTLASLKEKSLRGKIVKEKKVRKRIHYFLEDCPEDNHLTLDEDTDQVVANNGDYTPVEPVEPVEPVVIQNGDVLVVPVVPKGIKLSPEEENNISDELGLEWATLMSDLNRNDQCETSVGDQRRATLIGEYHDKGLSINRIANNIDKPAKDIKSYLRYHRFICNTDKSITSNVSRQIFHEYWAQVRDPQDVKNQSKLGVVEENGYFKFIEKLIVDGKPPFKVYKKPAPPDASTLKTAKQIRIELRRKFKEDFKPQLDWLKSLLGTDRSLYSPNGIAAAAYKLDEAFKDIDQFLAEISVVKEA